VIKQNSSHEEKKKRSTAPEDAPEGLLVNCQTPSASDEPESSSFFILGVGSVLGKEKANCFFQAEII